MFRPQRFVKIIFHSIKRSKIAFREDFEPVFEKLSNISLSRVIRRSKVLHIFNH